MLMVSYGWTLAETLKLTLPQVLLFFEAMGKTPPVGLLAAALVKGSLDKKAAGSTAEIEATLADSIGGSGSVRKVKKGSIANSLRGLKGLADGIDGG